MTLAVLVLNAIADVLLNLAAGWFAIVFVVPFTFQQVGKQQNPVILLFNTFFGIVAVAMAVLMILLVLALAVLKLASII